MKRESCTGGGWSNALRVAAVLGAFPLGTGIVITTRGVENWDVESCGGVLDEEISHDEEIGYRLEVTGLNRTLLELVLLEHAADQCWGAKAFGSLSSQAWVTAWVRGTEEITPERAAILVAAGFDNYFDNKKGETWRLSITGLHAHLAECVGPVKGGGH